MTDKQFKTIPGTINIPDNLVEFKQKEQVVWTGSDWRWKSSFTPTHGFTTQFPHPVDAYALQHTTDMYGPNAQTGLGIYASAGSAHTTNIEQYGDGRWMPASIFNGLGFEIEQTSGSTHAMYLKYYALVFASRDSNTDYRIWGVNTGISSPSTGYRFIRFLSNSSEVDTIRGWGPSWLFQGIILHIANNGGVGSDQSYLYAFNMKVGSKMSTTGSQYQYLPAGIRGYSQRDPRTGNNKLMNFNDLFS